MLQMWCQPKQAKYSNPHSNLVPLDSETQRKDYNEDFKTLGRFTQKMVAKSINFYGFIRHTHEIVPRTHFATLYTTLVQYCKLNTNMKIIGLINIMVMAESINCQRENSTLVNFPHLFFTRSLSSSLVTLNAAKHEAFFSQKKKDVSSLKKVAFFD